MEGGLKAQVKGCLVPSGGTACDQCGMDSAGRVEVRLRRQVGLIMEGPSWRI